MTTIFRRILSILSPESNIDLPRDIKNNMKVLLCPSCGNRMSVDAVYLKEDPRNNVKIIERALSCRICKVRIRQYIYLW